MPLPEIPPLKDYQAYAVDWVLNRLYTRDQMGAGVFLDPGLGKTRTSLTVADTLIRLGEVRRVLVVAPLRPVYSVWPDEIRKWRLNHSYIVLHDQHRQAMSENCKIEIVNPEGLKHLTKIKGRWDLLIVDESTKFKTWGTWRMRWLKKMLPHIPKRIILTGTPAANSLGDLFSQMYIVDDGEALGNTATYFRENYMTKGGYEGKQWVFREKMRAELLSLIDDKVLRMKAEDFLDMPKLLFRDVWCKLEPKEMREYKRLKKQLMAQLASGDIFAKTSGGAYAKCKGFANGTVYNTPEDEYGNKGKRETHAVHDKKLDALEDLLDELAGKPLLIGYQNTCDMERMKARQAFKAAPVIRGGMKAEEVQVIVKKWNKGHYRSMMCQVQSVSHGMNLQEACNDVAWLGLCDSPEVYDQFFRRIYRLGVKGDQVRIHRFLTEDTVDVTMRDRIEGKFATQSEFLEALKKHAA